MQHGNGKKIFPDGSEHNGNWRAGVRDGPGACIDARGQKIVGVFHDDVFGKAEEEGIVAPVSITVLLDACHGRGAPTFCEAPLFKSFSNRIWGAN